MMANVSSIALIGQMIGEPTRTGMLLLLMDGRALTAGELGSAAGVAPSTASGHLAALLDAGLIAVVRQGRHRYYRLASAEVGLLIETVMGVAGGGQDSSGTCKISTGPRDMELRKARTCYDHLAGSLACAIADTMQHRGHLLVADDGATLTADGGAFLRALGIELTARSGDYAPMLCRLCLDWSERRMHIGGGVGAALYQAVLAGHWVRRRQGTRSLEITPHGSAQLLRHFGIAV